MYGITPEKTLNEISLDISDITVRAKKKILVENYARINKGFFQKKKYVNKYL